MSSNKTNAALHNRIYLIALALLAAFALQHFVSPTHAQQTTPIPEIDLNLAWEGHIRTPGWTEIQVTLNNEANDWTGDLVIIDINNELHYNKSLVLPAHSRKYYRLPIFIKDNSSLQVQLRGTEGTTSVKQRLNLSPTYETRTCVLADAQGNILQNIWESCETLLLLNDLNTLPETAMAWDTTDVLILNGISTAELSPAQQQAMLAWVGAGGHLIVSGGAALPQTLANLPRPLQIATPGNAQSIEGLAGQLGGTGKMLAISLSPNEQPIGQIVSLLSTADEDYAIGRVFGRGTIDIIGWDVVHMQTYDWIENLWIKEPFPAAAIPLQQATSISNSTPNIYALLQVPYAAIPSQWQWLLLFPIYFLLVGPGTWFIVRRLQRPILAWILIPAWIVLALIVLAFGLSGTFSRAFPLIHEGAIIYAPAPDVPARAVQGTVIYAPRAQKLTWTSGGSPRPLAGGFLLDSWYGEGDPYPLKIYNLDEINQHEATKPLGIVTWGSEGLFTPPAINADLSIDMQTGSPTVSGTIYGTEPLRDVTLMLDNGQYRVSLTDILTPGVNIQISEVPTHTYPTYNWSANICQSLEIPTYGPPVRRSVPMITPPGSADISIPLTKQSTCFIMSILDKVPFPAEEIGGTHLTESCIIYTIPCPTQSTGTFQVTLNVDVSRIENGWMDEEFTVYLSSSESMIPYILPSFLNVQEIHKLTLKLLPASWLDPASYVPNTEIAQLFLLDWETTAWVEYPLPTSTQTLELSGADAERFFDAAQGVHLRVIPQRQDGVYIRAIITIEGIW